MRAMNRVAMRYIPARNDDAKDKPVTLAWSLKMKIKSWLEREVEHRPLQDVRRGRRFSTLLTQFLQEVGKAAVIRPKTTARPNLKSTEICQ